jgi:hypothetical protein
MVFARKNNTEAPIIAVNLGPFYGPFVCLFVNVVVGVPYDVNMDMGPGGVVVLVPVQVFFI